jgi:hypothetical protein
MAFRKVPQNIESWRGACRQAGVLRRSIHSFVGMHSGSKMTQEQYLLMRVLYPREKCITDFDPATYGLTQDSPEAIAFLSTFQEFQMLLHAIRTNPVFSHTHLGIFAIPRMNQLLIQRAPLPPATNNVLVQTINPPASSNSRSAAAAAAVVAAANAVAAAGTAGTTGTAAAATTGQLQKRDIDEEIINFHMITFLQALTGAIRNVSSEWSPRRFGFQTQFAIDQYEAQIDGYLQIHDATGKFQAIVEVKRDRRLVNQPNLEMQEAAEMVGWIMDNTHNIHQPDPSRVGR